MRGILGTRMAGEQTHGGKTIFPLIRRWCLGGPVDRGLPTHMGLGAVSGVAGKVPQQAFLNL